MPAVFAICCQVTGDHMTGEQFKNTSADEEDESYGATTNMTPKRYLFPCSQNKIVTSFVEKITLLTFQEMCMLLKNCGKIVTDCPTHTS